MTAYLDRPKRSLHEVAADLDAQIAAKRQQRARSVALIAQFDAELEALERRRDAVGDELCRKTGC